MKKYFPYLALLLTSSVCSICNAQNAGQLTEAERLFLGDNAQSYQSAYRRPANSYRHVRSASSYSNSRQITNNRFGLSQKPVTTTSERIANVDLVLPKIQENTKQPQVDSSLFRDKASAQSSATPSVTAKPVTVANTSTTAVADKPQALQVAPKPVSQLEAAKTDPKLTMSKPMKAEELIKLLKTTAGQQ